MLLAKDLNFLGFLNCKLDKIAIPLGLFCFCDLSEQEQQDQQDRKGNLDFVTLE